MRISHIMSASKILTDLRVIRQNVGLKSTFTDIACNF